MTSSINLFQPEKKSLFVPFVVAGHPTLDVTEDIALSLQRAGADAIELGIPFSDPLADGPVIQKASQMALQDDTLNLEQIMNRVSTMRQKGLTIPVIIFTYYNLLLHMGFERFFELAKENEIEGLLVPDLPYEESEEIRSLCKQHGIAYISLVAPTTNPERLLKIVSTAEGFVYCISSLGVTGERNDFHTSVHDFITNVHHQAEIPVLLGFGVSKNSHVEMASQICDGVIVGSAIVNKIHELQNQLKIEKTRKIALKEFEDFVSSFII